jgi:hypothetical protein
MKELNKGAKPTEEQLETIKKTATKVAKGFKKA